MACSRCSKKACKEKGKNEEREWAKGQTALIRKQKEALRSTLPVPLPLLNHILLLLVTTGKETLLLAEIICSNRGSGCHLSSASQKLDFWSSLVVQWLTLWVTNAGGPGSIPSQGTRAHMLQLKSSNSAMKIKDTGCCNYIRPKTAK